MRTILAVAALITLTACEAPFLPPADGRPPIFIPMSVYRPQPAPMYQPRQPITCYPAGYNITCY